jgi:hypothetical protein
MLKKLQEEKFQKEKIKKTEKKIEAKEMFKSPKLLKKNLLKIMESKNHTNLKKYLSPKNYKKNSFWSDKSGCEFFSSKFLSTIKSSLKKSHHSNQTNSMKNSKNQNKLTPDFKNVTFDKRKFTSPLSNNINIVNVPKTNSKSIFDSKNKFGKFSGHNFLLDNCNKENYDFDIFLKDVKNEFLKRSKKINFIQKEVQIMWSFLNQKKSKLNLKTIH